MRDESKAIRSATPAINVSCILCVCSKSRTSRGLQRPVRLQWEVIRQHLGLRSFDDERTHASPSFHERTIGQHKINANLGCSRSCRHLGAKQRAGDARCAVRARDQYCEARVQADLRDIGSPSRRFAVAALRVRGRRGVASVWVAQINEVLVQQNLGARCGKAVWV